jgi:ankyrin repeat protein
MQFHSLFHHILPHCSVALNDSQQARAAVNALDPQRRTALHICSSSGKNAFIPLLCRAGAHTELRDEQDATPLIAAVKV